MPDADPLYLAAANRVAQWVEGITDQAEDLPNPDLFEHADQDVCYHLSHLCSFAAATTAILAASKKLIPPRIRGAGFISGRSCVVSENVVAIFCGLVARKHVQPPHRRLAVREGGETVNR